MPPLVSVVIPVYNSAATVLDAVRSVLQQSYSELEVLIVDDGSPDDSIELCRQLTDPRIRIVVQQNRGLAGARNAGIRQARGAFVGFLDSDDLWAPTKVERHLDLFAQAPEVGVSFSCSAFIDEGGEPLGIFQLGRLRGITPEYLFSRNPIGNGSAVILRREVLDAIAYPSDLHGTTETFWFDESFRQSEDVECWIRIALTTAWGFEGLPDVLTSYRVSSGGLSANVMKQYESWQRVLAKVASYDPEFVQRWGNKARSYQLRYLSRRATQLRSSSLAISLINQALVLHWKLLIEEPMRTLITLAAAYLLVILPPPLYVRLESLMIGATGSGQKRLLDRQAGRSTHPPAHRSESPPP